MYKKILALIIVVMFQSNIALAKSSLTTSGDILQFAIPIAAFGTTFYKDDSEGKIEFTKSFLVNTAITHGLKFALKDTEWGKRPNGGDYSFPSGHASSAFQGAFFLQRRYGAEYGAPAIALAAFTGYTRVRGDYHHWRDVIGGAGIAFGVNYFLVTKYEKQQVTVDISKNSAMLNFKTSF